MLGAVCRSVFAAAVGLLFLLQSDRCGYEPPPLSRRGEPCTRTSECEAGLVCRGGVCMDAMDAGEALDDGAVDTD